MSRKRNDRAVGPYQRGGSWRVVYIGADGSRETKSYESQSEARRERDLYNRIATNRTVDEAVTAYLDWLRTEGPKGRPLRESSVVTAGYRLKAILKPDGRSLLSITPKEATRLYQHRTELAKGDTHRGELTVVTGMFDFCVDVKRWLEANPFAEVKPRGQLSTGKEVLRLNEAREFYSVCIAENSVPSIAAATALLMGLRAGELAGLKVEDLDDNGSLLWIVRGKTRNAVRQVRVPLSLRAPLGCLAEGKLPEAALFTGLTRYSLHHHVGRLCRLAGVRVVCPHGLRGSAATVAVDLGIDLGQVAAGLGHGNTSVTRRHYIGGGAEQSAGADRAEASIVQPGGSGNEVETVRTEPLPPSDETNPEVFN